MIDFNLSEQELEKISTFRKNIEAALEFGIKSALEEKGYKFNDDYEFLKFCIMEMNLCTEVRIGAPSNRRYIAKLKGHEEELFSLSVSFKIDFPNNYAHLSDLRGKLSFESGDDIDKQLKELRDDWDRND